MRLGMAPPTTPPAQADYYYPTSIGILPPYEKSAIFYTTDWDPALGAAPLNQANGSTDPRVTMTYGTLNITYPILSQPSIYYDTASARRYVYVNNANCLFRYDTTVVANAPTTRWKDATGPRVMYAQTEAGRAANGTVYNGTAFHFNATAPLVDGQGKVYTLDTRSTAPLTYTYNLNRFNGTILEAPAADMAAPLTFKQIAAGVPSQVFDNAGIYLTGGSYQTTEAYFGLVNGRIYRVSLK